MANCDCTYTPSNGSLPTVTSLVTYDGVATCTGFTSGTLNDWITHVSDIVCGIITDIAALSFNMDDISLGTFSGTCINTSGMTNLDEFLTEFEDQFCTLSSTVSSLSLSDVSDTFDLSCLNPSLTSVNTHDTITYLVQYMCLTILGGYIPWLLRSGGDYELPLSQYAKDTVIITDISGAGVASINIDATDYWINAKALEMVSTNIDLVDSSDNYIFIDNDTDNYTITAVGIGAASPTTNGDKICMVRTGVGTVTSSSLIIGYTPIPADLMGDDIGAANLDSSICTSPLENDGSNIILNYNTTNFDVSAGDLILKDGGVNTPAKIASSVFEGSIGLSAVSKWQVQTQGSVENNAVNDKIQLVGDSTSPGNSYYYGTNASGTKGFYGLSTIVALNETDWVKISSAEILQLNTTPIELIAAPGLDNYIIVDHVEFFNDHGGTDYVSNALEFRHTNGSGVKVAADVPQASMQASADAFYHSVSASGVATKNANIVAYVPTANPTTGNGDIYVKLFYKIINR